MTATAFFLILASVVMHASWHFINKTGRPTYPYFCVFSFALFLTMLPLLLLSGIRIWNLPSNVLLFVAAGGFFGMLGDVGLSWAYRTTDMSVSYPLAPQWLGFVQLSCIVGRKGFDFQSSDYT